MDISAPPGLENVAPLVRGHLRSDCLATSPPLRTALVDDATRLAVSEPMPTLLVQDLVRQNIELRTRLSMMVENVALVRNLKRCQGGMDHCSLNQKRNQNMSQKRGMPGFILGQSEFTMPLETPSGAVSSTAGSGAVSEVSECDIDANVLEQSEVGRESQTGHRRKASTALADQRLRTTAMMRNIPIQYTRANLLDLLDQQGFSGLYDFVYLTVDFETELNHGYAFINFVTADTVEKFRKQFADFTDWLVPSDKACQIYWSDTLQGVDEHIERYRNSPMMHESVEDRFRPVLFKHGQRIPFPAPTKRIRMPRCRRGGLRGQPTC